MIRCLLIRISRDRNGQPVRNESLVAGETIQIGRAAECKIPLLDHRIDLHHAVIRRSEEGKLFIEAEEGSEIAVDGSPVSHAELTPGTHILIGPYELAVESPSGECDLALSQELAHPLPESQEQISVKQAPLTLAETGLSKRKLALWLAGAIVLAFLFLPMMPAVNQTLPKWAASLHASIKKSWQLGEMSRGHHLIAAKCDICHQKPFEAVPDSACESCHKDTARHIEDKTLQANAFKGMRCGECHHEHRGDLKEGALGKQCISCHAKIKKKAPKTRLPDIHDFSKDHPAFSLTFRTGHKDSDIVRIPQRDKARLVEKSGLKFSHKVHLDKKGIASPEGDTVLECRDCHRLDEAGTRFKPISMERDCQQSGCHSLRFKPPMAGRQVPHGPERNVMTALREYHTAIAIEKMTKGEKFPCGNGPVTGKNRLERAMDCAANNASTNANLLFRPDRGCGECHEITQVADDKDIPWKVSSVTITSHWLRNSRFSHAKHSTSKCTECHDKTLSDKSSDVSIPPIEKCRECHVGNKPSKNRISSRCDNCHRFHETDRHQPAIATQ